jgi:hypothetical protein
MDQEAYSGFRRASAHTSGTSGSQEAAKYIVRSVRRLLVAASVVPSSPIVVTLMEALSYSETSGLTRATWRNIPEDTILHSHRRENPQILQILARLCWTVNELHPDTNTWEPLRVLRGVALL